MIRICLAAVLFVTTALPTGTQACNSVWISPHSHSTGHVQGIWGEPVSTADFGLVPAGELALSLDLSIRHLETSNWNDKLQVERSVALLTADLGLSGRVSVGIRIPTVHLTKSDDADRTGPGDLHFSLRTALVQSGEYDDLVALGVGLKLPTGRSPRRYDVYRNDRYSHSFWDLAMTTNTYDLTMGVYASTKQGNAGFYAYFGTAIPIGTRNEMLEHHSGAVMWDLTAGVPLHRSASFLVGISGYSLKNDDRGELRVSGLLRGAMNESGSVQFEGGLGYNLGGDSGSGIGIDFGLRFGIGH